MGSLVIIIAQVHTTRKVKDKMKVQHTHCQIRVIDHDKVDEFAKKYCKKGWIYAFVKFPNGKFILCEVMLFDGEGGYCPASGDLVDKKEFDECVKYDKDFYGGITWEQYRSNLLKDVLFPIKMKCGC